MDREIEFYKGIVDSLYDGVYFVDRGRKVTYWNSAAEKISGYKSPEVIGKRCVNGILMHVNRDGKNVCAGECPAAAVMDDGHEHKEELYLHHKDGYRVPVVTRIIPVSDRGGKVIDAVEIFREISSQIFIRERLQELERMALLDVLTGLGNRKYAQINLRARLEEMSRYGWVFGILFVDIDHFKKVNDVYGHDCVRQGVADGGKYAVQRREIFRYGVTMGR